MNEQRELLGRQRELVDQMRDSWRNRTDAAQLDRMATEELAKIEAALDLLRQVEFLHATGIRPAEDFPNTFYYQRGSETRLHEFFGADKVRGPDKDGTIHVQQRAGDLIFRPEPEGQAAEQEPARDPMGSTRGRMNYRLRFGRNGNPTGSSRTSVDELTNAVEKLAESATYFQENSVLRNPSESGAPLALDIPIFAAGAPPSVSVEVKLDIVDARAWQPGAGAHGNESGPARYQLSRANGKWSMKVDLHSALRPEDIPSIMGHELSEAARIIAGLYRDGAVADNYANDELRTLITPETLPRVFRADPAPASNPPVTQDTELSAHDYGSVQELVRTFVHFRTLTQGANDARNFTVEQRDALTLLDRILEDMGFFQKGNSPTRLDAPEFQIRLSRLRQMLGTETEPGSLTLSPDIGTVPTRLKVTRVQEGRDNRKYTIRDKQVVPTATRNQLIDFIQYSRTRRARMGNYNREIDPKQIRAAEAAISVDPADPIRGGHALSDHKLDTMSPDDFNKMLANILNNPERIFTGYYRVTHRAVDVYYRDKQVVITERGHKERVVTAYGEGFRGRNDEPSEPVTPDRWANPKNWASNMGEKLPGSTYSTTDI